MTHVTEHNTEKEGEGSHGQYCWISFLILWNTISIYD